MTPPAGGATPRKPWLAGALVFLAFWGYEHTFWTTYDPTLGADAEQPLFDALGIYTISKQIHRHGVHSEAVVQNLWGTMPYYCYAAGMAVFGEHLSTVRKVIALASGFWGLVLFAVVLGETRKASTALLLALVLMPFAGHLNFVNRGYASFFTFLLNVVSLLAMRHYAQDRRSRWLALAGLAPGVGFAFKYELSLIGLAGTFMALYALEALDAAGSRNSLPPAARCVKTALLAAPFLIGAFLVSIGMRLHLFILLGWSCLILAALEVKILLAGRGGAAGDMSALLRPIRQVACVAVPFVACVGFWFAHIWQMEGLDAAVAYFARISGTATQVREMGLCSPAFSDPEYFQRVHPLPWTHLGLWLAAGGGGALLAAGRFGRRHPLVTAALLGLALIPLFHWLLGNQIHSFSMYYFTAGTAFGLWAAWGSQTLRKGAGPTTARMAVYLCFLAAGSLGLLRESGSLDHDVWPTLPPLLGALLLACREESARRSAAGFHLSGLAAVFYFTFLLWGRVESQVIWTDTLDAQMKKVDEEIDLKIPPATAAELRRLRGYIARRLGPTDELYVFSPHIFPYLYTADRGLFVRRMPNPPFVRPDDEDRLIEAIRRKRPPVVLYSHGIVPYRSDRMAGIYPRLARLLDDMYAPTDNRFLNFVAHERRDAR